MNRTSKTVTSMKSSQPYVRFSSAVAEGEEARVTFHNRTPASGGGLVDCGEDALILQGKNLYAGATLKTEEATALPNWLTHHLKTLAAAGLPMSS